MTWTTFLLKIGLTLAVIGIPGTIVLAGVADPHHKATKWTMVLFATLVIAACLGGLSGLLALIVWIWS